MKTKAFIISGVISFMLLSGAMSNVQAQCGNSTPSTPWDCDPEYLWPPTIQPCPEVQIKQKHDHTSKREYRELGWDTAVTCNTTSLVLSCTPYIPVQNFNGCYTVDEITYNPADPTFHGGSLLNITSDDIFCGSSTNIPFPFYFFGIKKNAFVVGSNGMLTFNTSATGNSCSWSYSAPLPWPDGTSGAPGNTSYMRDAIYGVYEDTHPLSSYCNSYGPPNYQGIWYGVQGQYPCRKVICSWNDVPEYQGSSNLDNRCTYQIVCYEGSNMVEVHVRRRGVNTSWQNGIGTIGIQNATGTPQQPSTDPTASNYYVRPNSPAAFWPAGYNTTNQIFTNKAFRFTPQGTTPKSYGWYRILDDGTTVALSLYDDDHPDAINDTNGYYEPMPDDLTDPCPNLTLAHISPTCTSRYYFELNFITGTGSDQVQYHLRDTITVGYDHFKLTEFVPQESSICDGSGTSTRLHFKKIQDTVRTSWSIYRGNGGAVAPLPTSLLHFGNISILGSDKYLPVSIYSTEISRDGLPKDWVDSIYIHVDVEYTNGCDSFATALIRINPNFDDTINVTICEGQTYHFTANNTDYRNPIVVTVPLISQAGCDSLVTLDLDVSPASHTIDTVFDCKDVIWHGQRYTHSNDATFDRDTLRMTNIYGCDSIVQLYLTIIPLKARLHSSLDHFDFDHLDVTLTDLSIGGDSNTWKFPAPAPDQQGPTAYYSIPLDASGAKIVLYEYSPYGCVSSDSIYIPFDKEHFWVPSAFTPDNPAGNSLFGSVSTETVHQEMLIYNRRGELVYRCEGVDCTWDGRDMNGEKCVQGAYVYIIRYTNSFDVHKTNVKKGTVTLIR